MFEAVPVSEVSMEAAHHCDSLLNLRAARFQRELMADFYRFRYLSVTKSQSVAIPGKPEARKKEPTPREVLKTDDIDFENVELVYLEALDRKSKHDVGIIVDRVSIQKAQRGRLADSVESALDLGKGWMQVVYVDDSRPEPQWKTEPFSLH